MTTEKWTKENCLTCEVLMPARVTDLIVGGGSDIKAGPPCSSELVAKIPVHMHVNPCP